MGNACCVVKGEKDDDEGLRRMPSSETEDIVESRPMPSTIWKLTKRQEDDCEEVFSVFEDENEMVPIENIGPMMRALNHQPSEEELNHIITRCNNEQNGLMTFPVFLKIMAPRVAKANEIYAEDNMRAAFRRFDVDHNGYISASELRTVLKESFCNDFNRVAEALTDYDVEEIMGEADLNGDGKISYSEFKEVIPQLSTCIKTPMKIK